MSEVFKRSLSYILVAGGNAVVLLGVLLWQWNIFDVFYLYWIENVVIGVITLIRLLASGRRFGIFGLIGALFMGAFFTFHYGMFTMVHGIFLIVFFLPEHMASVLSETVIFSEPLNLLFLPSILNMQGFGYIFAGILLVEIVYGARALIDDKREKRPINAIMGSPYGRIIVLHLTILFGGAVFLIMQVPAAAVTLFVVLKTLYDLGLMARHDYKKDRPKKPQPIEKDSSHAVEQ
jgi:hypothetical protein